MSRGQRELSIAQRRHRRYVSPARNNANDLVGIPWKEERDLRKAIYDSLRDQHLNPSHRPFCSKRKTGKAFVGATLPAKSEKIKKMEGGISANPHPRKSRPLPGSLSHQFLLTSSYSRSSFALLSLTSAAARRSLARAAASHAKPPPSTKTALSRARTITRSPKRLSGGVRGFRRGGIAATATDHGLVKKKVEGDVVEVMVEGDDGEFVSQIISTATVNRATTPKPVQSAEIRTPPQQPPSASTLPPVLWQDSHGRPVDTHDFVDFLCYYGTPCLTAKLAWFADSPGRRAHALLGCRGGGKQALPPAISITPTTAVAAPILIPSAPAVAAPATTTTTPHKTPVFVARKTASIVSHPLNASASLVFCEPSAKTAPVQSVCLRRRHMKSRSS